MAMRARSALLLSLVLSTGCGDLNGKDAKIPGEPLGTYHVVGSLDASTCGPGALGSSDVWEFDVKLSRDGNDLYWLNGQEAIYGRIAADGVTFAFDSRVEVPSVDPGPGYPGCVVVRTDTASGKLSSASVDVTSFGGLLRFGYAPQAGSDCTPLVGVDGGFAGLPCEIGYDLAADRTETP
jgi:hypothetical protein